MQLAGPACTHQQCTFALSVTDAEKGIDNSTLNTAWNAAHYVLKQVCHRRLRRSHASASMPNACIHKYTILAWDFVALVSGIMLQVAGGSPAPRAYPKCSTGCKELSEVTSSAGLAAEDIPQMKCSAQ